MKRLLYAVGDIHGCAKLMEKALIWIQRQSGSVPFHVIFIGDYIDRGPESKSVLDILMAGPQRQDDRYACIRGNHEQMCLDSKLSDHHLDEWLANGGDATLDSFGGSIGSAYSDWMGALPFWHEDNLRIFVHAGLEPGIALSNQDPETLLWIREPFLTSRRSFGKHVVHGHTPTGPTLLSNRTNIDAGSFRSGKLCVAAFLDQYNPLPTALRVFE
jgi:serine/threonine protein phosphatase 1